MGQMGTPLVQKMIGRIVRQVAIILFHVVAWPFYLFTSAIVMLALMLFRMNASQPVMMRKKTESQPGVSVVIPSSDGYDLLKDSLPPLVNSLKQSGLLFEVILVDNGAEDRRLDDLINGYDSRVILKRLDTPVGFSKACNVGAIIAGYNTLFMLNNDMHVSSGTVKELVNALWSDQTTFAVTAQIEMDERSSKGHVETGYTTLISYLGMMMPAHSPMPSRPHSDLLSVAYPGGGSSVYRTDRFLALGGFPELYSPFYFEDLALGMYAQDVGWNTHLLVGTTVVHKHRSTIGRLPTSKVHKIIERNANLFNLEYVTTHGGKLRYWVFSPLYRLKRDLDSCSLSAVIGYCLSLVRICQMISPNQSVKPSNQRKGNKII